MISRLDMLQGRDIYENTALAKLNEVIDAVNELQNRIDPPSVYQVMKDKDAIIGKHIGEKQRLQDELERTRKALSYAIGVIQTVAKMSDKLSREYGETLVEQLDNIQAYCWQEGYVLTHKEDLSKALTALEQKDK